MSVDRGTKLGDGLIVQRTKSKGLGWSICQTFAKDDVLLVLDLLLEKWIKLHLVTWEMFHELPTKGARSFYTVSVQEKRLESLMEADAPGSLDDAQAFASALHETRRIVGVDVPLGTAIYFEEYARLLPTFEEAKDTAPMPDDIVLGRWLTGGVPISVKKLQEVGHLMTWTSAERIKEIADASGIVVELPKEETEAAEQAGKSKHELPTEPFVLYGRQKLTEFINDYIIDIIRQSEAYARMGIDFPGAMLMYGPPGSGKTYAAEKIAEYLGWPTFYVNSGTIGSTYIHETSKKISDLFTEAMKKAPSVVLIDEMESFLSSRAYSGHNLHHTEEVDEFLLLLQKAKEKHVLVLAMTNRLDDIDEAVKRKGRFDHVIEVGMPSKEEITTLLEKQLADLPTESDLQVDKLAEKLVGKSMADVAYLVKEAGRRTVKAKKARISQDILEEVIGGIKDGEKKRIIGFQTGTAGDKE